MTGLHAVPGSVGWPVIGDKSYEFYKNPTDFLQKYMNQNKSRIFVIRFLNKPTVFVCSNSGVEKVLAGWYKNVISSYSHD